MVLTAKMFVLPLFTIDWGKRFALGLLWICIYSLFPDTSTFSQYGSIITDTMYLCFKYLFPFNVGHNSHQGYEAERHFKTFA